MYNYTALDATQKPIFFHRPTAVRRPRASRARACLAAGTPRRRGLRAAPPARAPLAGTRAVTVTCTKLLVCVWVQKLSNVWVLVTRLWHPDFY